MSKIYFAEVPTGGTVGGIYREPYEKFKQLVEKIRNHEALSLVRDGRTKCCEALIDEGKCCKCRRPISED